MTFLTTFGGWVTDSMSQVDNVGSLVVRATTPMIGANILVAKAITLATDASNPVTEAICQRFDNRSHHSGGWRHHSSSSCPLSGCRRHRSSYNYDSLVTRPPTPAILVTQLLILFVCLKIFNCHTKYLKILFILLQNKQSISQSSYLLYYISLNFCIILVQHLICPMVLTFYDTNLKVDLGHTIEK